MDSAPAKSSQYYWDSIVFLVERELFKVPRWAFEKRSSVFSHAFNLPRSGEGKDSKKPLVLPDITKREFESLLSVLYPTDILHGLHLSSDEWESVLKLASKYRFSEARVLAIKQLWKVEDPVKRIVLGRAYGMPDWLRSGYIQLVIRPETIEESDAERLGWQIAMRLFQLRERNILFSAQKQEGDERGQKMTPKELMNTVEKMFGEDIHAAEELHSQHEPEPEDIEETTLLCPTSDLESIDLNFELS